jgi:hypothetical protein
MLARRSITTVPATIKRRKTRSKSIAAYID